MLPYLKILLIIVLLIICHQDYKDRLVYWLLYPIVGILGFGIQMLILNNESVFINSAINLIFISLLLLITYLYTTVFLKKKWLNETIGLGDILLFVFLCFTFSFASFLILFTFSLLFSLLLHNLSSFSKENNLTHKNVPLAGYIALFFSGVYLVTFFFNCNYLFAY